MTSREVGWAAAAGERTAAELGEVGVIALATARVEPDSRMPVGPGDDAAVVTAPDGRMVVSSDALVEGRHFRADLTTPELVGRRAIAQNAADIAAMGAVCTAFTVTLGIPAALSESAVAGIASGLALGAAVAGGVIAGGDVVRSEYLFLAITALGSLQGRAPVLIAGAERGDAVAVCGTLGYSAAGLDALKALRGNDFGEFSQIYRCPEPPLPAGPQAADAGATAMTDVSDGLLRDLRSLARASGVDVDLRAQALAPGPRLAECAHAVGGDAWQWVLTGGEDHALLATFPPAVVPEGWRVIGTAGQAGAAGPGTVTVDGAPVAGRGGWGTFDSGE